MTQLNSIKKELVALLLGGFAVISIQKVTLQKYFTVEARKSSGTESIQSSADMPSISKNVPAFGLDNLVADYTFIQFLLYFGDDTVRALTDYKASPAFFETILHRDPYFRDFYLFLSQSTSVYAGLPDKSIHMMNTALQELAPNQPSDGYHIWRYKGVDELLFAGDNQAARRSFEISAAWASQSEEPDSQAMSQMSQQTAQFLATNPDSKQAQVSAWGSILMTALDDDTRIKAIQEIRELGGDVRFGEDGGIRIKYVQANHNQPEDNSDS